MPLRRRSPSASYYEDPCTRPATPQPTHTRTKRRPSTTFDEPSNHRSSKRQLIHHLSVEELADNQDPAYDGDVEVRRPDDYSDPDTVASDASDVEELSISPTNPASLAEDFGRLRCSPRGVERRRAGRRVARVALGNVNHKRVHSESLPTETEVEEVEQMEDVNDQDRSVRRQKRRLDNRGNHQQSGLLVGDASSPLHQRVEVRAENGGRHEFESSGGYVRDAYAAERGLTPTSDVEEMMDLDIHSP